MKAHQVILSLALLTACSQPKHKVIVDNTPTAAQPVKTGKNVEWLIKPGQSIGITHLNDVADSVYARLGKPDVTDAAMGKSLAIWYTRHDSTANQTAVFFSRQMGTNNEASRVKQIRVTSPKFVTDDGLNVGKPLEKLSTALTLTKVATYIEEGRGFTLFDDAEKGIAFEIDAEQKCAGIIVHQAGEKLTINYLPFHSNIKPVK